MSFQSPAFIAFTGVDRPDIKDDMLALSARYPIERAILIDADQGNLFPGAAMRVAPLSRRMHRE